ncbi:putative glycosyl hydrolase ecdE isoform X2 [Nematostella vectensis]|uniref:putative glycosyl hydrolase ecdE isoform X2 n=1 Tax=Nematostella vectensis TaxID=45351 RepID=UPI00139058C7|nr:putative glycosyl hydrolase ecdE isoform X2 [Nematostella vectensis]
MVHVDVCGLYFFMNTKVRSQTKCTDNPCKNGGVCSPLENGGELFSCTCPASHTGDVCHYLLDTPTGTLTSPPFKFLGPTLSFMIGGGCDVNYERAELLIDGAVVHKSTGIKKADGYCQSETMGKASWDVSAYLGRTAHVRLVDASSGNWGHINFDHVTDSCP